MSTWESLESSQPTKAARSRAAVSMKWVALAPQPTQRQRCEPGLVFPLRFMGNPQDGHVILFTAPPKVVSLEFYNKKWTLTWINVHFRTHFLSYKPSSARIAGGLLGAATHAPD